MNDHLARAFWTSAGLRVASYHKKAQFLWQAHTLDPLDPDINSWMGVLKRPADCGAFKKFWMRHPAAGHESACLEPARRDLEWEKNRDKKLHG